MRSLSHEVASLLAAGELRAFPGGATIFREGDVGDALYGIEEGRVAATVTSLEGQQLTYAIMGPGDWFGELALVLPDLRRSASVLALESTMTRIVTRADFERLRSSRPEINEALVQILAARVARLSDHLREALHMGAEARIRRRLLEVARLYETSGPGRVPLTQSQLAELAGASRATVNRVLRQEERAGTLRLGRGFLEVLDAAGISKSADRVSAPTASDRGSPDWRLQ